jgi:transcription elongation factor Elf1
MKQNKKKKQKRNPKLKHIPMKDNFMCRYCPHSKYSLREDGTCAGVDAAGDICDCPQYVPDKMSPVLY